MRKEIFANEEYYHVYNRGVDKRIIFGDDADYQRFLLSMHFLNNTMNGLMHIWKDCARNKVQPRVNPRLNLVGEKRLVDIIAYCLNSNHYHFLLKQNVDKGIEKFMQKLGTSYTMYYNKRNQRAGSLFQGRFKSIHVDTNEYLLYVSAYINHNNFIHGGKIDWQYGSLLDYMGKRNGRLCKKDVILGQFQSYDDYSKFVEDHAMFFKEKKELQKYILE